MRKLLTVLLLITLITTNFPIKAETYNVPKINSKLELPVINQKNNVHVASIESNISLSNVTQRIAIIDTGIALGHSALSSMNIVHRRNMFNNSTDITDQHGHGTHVAGILASTGTNHGVTGIIPNAKYIIIKALNNEGESDDFTLAQSIRHAVNQGARVILASSGTSVHSNELKSAVDYAYNNNVIIVAAAGNNMIHSQYPAAYSNVISVGSVNLNGSRSSFSPTGYETDVLAVGENVLSLNTTNGTRFLSGTSMAAPKVAAIALALIEFYPTVGIDEIISHIYLTSSTSNNWNVNRGWGIASIERALLTAIGGTPTLSNNITAGRAIPLPRSTIISSALTSQKDTDWFRLATGSAGQVSLHLKKSNNNSLRVDLFDSNLRLVDTRNIASNIMKVNFNVNTDGMYLRIINNSSTSMKYSIITDFVIAQDIWESNNVIQQSKKIPLRANFQANFHQAGDTDWYHVDVVERGYMHVNIINVPLHMDPVLQIQGNNNVYMIDYNAAGKEERSVRFVEPGRYHFRVTDYNQNIINYHYTVDVGFVPININRFADINNHWARNNIHKLLAQGIVRGYSNNQFRPSNNVTRAEFTTMLISTMKLAYPESNGRTYRDVPTNHWAHHSISIANQFDVIKGYPDQTFRPDSFITRAEIATMVYGMFADQLQYNVVSRYNDVQFNHWAYTPIMNLTRAEILTGYSNHQFRPNSYITRAEAATVISRLLEI